MSMRIEPGLLARLRRVARSDYGPPMSKIISRGIELALEEVEEQRDAADAATSAKRKRRA